MLGFFKRHKRALTLIGLLVLFAEAGITGLLYFQNSLESQVTPLAFTPGVLTAQDNGLPQNFLTALKDDGNHEPTNILVIGSDTREGQGGGFGSIEETPGGRSDTTILLHLSADRESATAMSIPRDLNVDIPSCPSLDGKGVTEPIYDRFNTAYMIGGTECTTRTVKAFTGIPIHHVAVVDFKGFQKIVDRLGGLPVCLEEAVDDDYARVKLRAGPQVLNGEEALGLMRARYSLGDGSDLSRINRQHQVARSLITLAEKKNYLTDPTALYDILSGTMDHLSTDPELAKLPAMAGLAWQLRNISQDDIHFTTVPNVYNDDNVTVDVHEAPARKLFTQILEDRKPPVADNPVVKKPSSSTSSKKTKTNSICKPGQVQILTGSGS